MDAAVPRLAVVVLGCNEDIAFLACGHFCLSRTTTRCCACDAPTSPCRLCRPSVANGRVAARPTPTVK